MTFLNRLKETAQIDVNDLIEQAEDPEKALDQVISDMQEVLIQTRAVVSSIDSIPNTKAKFNYSVAAAEVSKWQENLRKAQRANNEHLTFYARERLKNHEASARIAKAQLDKYTEHEDILKQSLALLQEKVAEAKARKCLLKSNGTTEQSLPRVIKASNPTLESELRKIEYELESTKIQLLDQQKMTSQLLERNSTALKQIKKILIELKFNKDVDDELAAMKAQIAANPKPSTTTLTPSE
ncbi:MAG TPA: PspA/IM30 family protein [Waterburya sp.]